MGKDSSEHRPFETPPCFARLLTASTYCFRVPPASAKYISRNPERVTRPETSLAPDDVLGFIVGPPKSRCRWWGAPLAARHYAEKNANAAEEEKPVFSGDKRKIDLRPGHLILESERFVQVEGRKR
ncbi:hypothetical protein HNY73_001147 [Argiope bruennichi]|uniref:Uncharacterized protein n=1 Tax=Argiope bruennichi TaxID=94029 RepID=A0A8T0G441_ARGBR|nr:hypothetical protein HNY73_001147 [Argiope bruennichi]